MKNLIIGALLCATAIYGHAASFNCAKSTTSVEKAICGNKTISRLDDTLSSNFKQMSAANIGDSTRKNLKASQKSWLRQRNECKTDRCIETLYRSRIDEICEIPVISGVYPECTYSDDIK